MDMDSKQTGWNWRLCAAALFSGLLATTFLPHLRAAEEMDVRRDVVVKAIERALPSVVSIATATIVEKPVDPFSDPFWRFYHFQIPTQRSEEPLYVGSGVIIDEEGYILTNVHVLERASRVQVKLSDGRIYNAAPLVYTRNSDIVLIKISRKPGEPPFQPIRFAKDDDLLLGETVIALGNPYGLGVSAARGILSSKNRRPASGNEALSVNDWLQTDAAINPGNSGGPLIDLRGEMIGINVAQYREEQGMGVAFAIPVKQVSASISGFFVPELTDSLWFGAKFRAGPYPLTVTEVQPGSPAEKAGLRAGQHIVQVNGKSPGRLVECFQAIVTSPGNLAELQVEDDGRTRTVRVQMISFESLIRQKLGLALGALTSETAASFGMTTSAALLIKTVEKDSPADGAQLKAGFLLSSVDGKTASDVNTVAQLLSGKQKGESVQLVVLLPQYANGILAGFRQGTVDIKLR